MVRKWFYSEFVAGKTWFDWCFLLLGLLLQVVVFCMDPQRPILIVSGIAGVFSVVLCSQGKISSFLFGFVQVITYLIISWQECLYAEVAMNVFYFVSMLYGVWGWKQSYSISADSQETVLETRHLPLLHGVVLLLLFSLLSVAAGWGLARYTNDSQPYFDAFTTVPAILAQLLMIGRYRDQWYYWLMIDILAAIMWARAENWSMSVLYVFWCMNCIYGYMNWRGSDVENNKNE